MRVKAIGVKRLSGIGKTSGKPFDFAQITILRPIEVTASESFSAQGYGYEVSEIDLSVEALPKFAEVRFPAELDVQVDTLPGRKGLRSVVVGFLAQAKPASAA